MPINQNPNATGRRQFLGSLTLGAAAMGFANLAIPTAAMANETPLGDADEWFNKVKGTHRVVFDCTEPNGIMPFAWPRVFLMTNAMTGSNESDCGVVVILRHNAMPFALDNSLWEKYKIGEMIKFDDPKTGKPSTRNPFWKPGHDDFKVPGFGAIQIGINDLQSSGVMVCACNAALTVFTAEVAQATNQQASDVLAEWTKGVLPEIQLVPSGVWAAGRAQEHKCAYIYAG